MSKKKTAVDESVSNIRNQGLTVVIPTYNGATWLPETLARISASIQEAGLEKYEVLIVNDGSSDNTVEVVGELIRHADFSLRLVTQKNGGRFVARQTGTNEAKYPYILFVDTRVFIGKSSLKYAIEQNAVDPSREVWCSHVRVDKEGNIYARFWETVAFVAWRKYFKQPKDTSYGIKHFDDYPKGTTCFLIKKSILQDANTWFVSNTKDLKTSSDDTLLLRYIAESNSINISPDFWCLYHARSAFGQYVRHVFHRGKVFVDGFLRNDGNRFFIPLIAFLLLSALVPVALLLWPQFIVSGVLVLLAGWLLELLVFLAIGVPYKDALSAVLLTPVFAAYYGAGIWQAFLRIYVFRSTRKAASVK